MVTRKRKATAKVKTAPRYTTRSRKPTPKMKEATPAYTARSRQVPTRTKKHAPAPKRRSNAKEASPGEALWEFFLKLPEEEQGDFIEKMLEDREWREDIMDICVMISRRGEPTRPLEEYIAEADRKRRK